MNQQHRRQSTPHSLEPQLSASTSHATHEQPVGGSHGNAAAQDALLARETSMPLSEHPASGNSTTWLDGSASVDGEELADMMGVSVDHDAHDVGALVGAQATGTEQPTLLGLPFQPSVLQADADTSQKLGDWLQSPGGDADLKSILLCKNSGSDSQGQQNKDKALALDLTSTVLGLKGAAKDVVAAKSAILKATADIESIGKSSDDNGAALWAGVSLVQNLSGCAANIHGAYIKSAEQIQGLKVTDKTELQKVLSWANVVINAVKFTDQVRKVNTRFKTFKDVEKWALSVGNAFSTGGSLIAPALGAQPNLIKAYFGGLFAAPSRYIGHFLKLMTDRYKKIDEETKDKNGGSKNLKEGTMG